MGCKILSKVSFVHVLSVFFGIGSWLTINGVWVELPQLVLHQPEGWALSSYFSIIVQIANIGPLTYSVVNHVVKSTLTDLVAVVLTTGVGSTACLLLAFFWNHTIYFAGQIRSVPLLSLVFLMALVDCTSSVLFLPFMAAFKEKYLTSYLVGEGLSGLMPSVLALTQGVGSYPECREVNITDDYNVTKTQVQSFYMDPRFSTGNFFILLFVMNILSLTSFLLLSLLPILKSEKVTELATTKASSKIEVKYLEVPKTEESKLLNTNHLKRRTKFYLLFLQGWLCALSNGVFTSIQTYSCLPYGNEAFHLSVTLSTIVNPLACAVSYFLPTKNVAFINVLVATGTLISGYLMATAVLSPTPPLVNTTFGEILIVASWVLFASSFSYAKANVANVLRQEGKRALFWCGVWTQIGSAIGAIIMFILINNYNIFKSYDPCTNV